MRNRLFCGLILGLAFIQPASADATLADAIAAGRPVVDLRWRYEDVSDKSKAIVASAPTLRARLGYETGSWNGLSLQADFDQVWVTGGATYNSTRNGKAAYPIIADPAMTTLNRLQLTYVSDFDTKISIGRQRLLIGNQRFVGNSAWRQHEQTFDSVALVNNSVPGLTATYFYLYRINRFGGPALPLPSTTTAAATGQANYFKSNSHIVDAVYTGIASLKLEGYAFLLDLSAPGFATTPAQQTATAKLSTATYGARGEYGVVIAPGLQLKFNGEYARQTNYAHNPLSYGLNYWLGEAGAGYGPATGLIGYEVLSGNGTIGFSTPLATLHAFNGWADMFLSTPNNGLKDLYVKAVYSLPADFIGMKSLTGTAYYHSYDTDKLHAGMGSEWDVQGELAVDASLSFLVKYADYQGSGLPFGGFADKSIAWLQLAYKY